MHGIVVLQCCFSWTHIPHLLLNREVGGRDGLIIIGEHSATATSLYALVQVLRGVTSAEIII